MCCTRGLCWTCLSCTTVGIGSASHSPRIGLIWNFDVSNFSWWSPEICYNEVQLYNNSVVVKNSKIFTATFLAHPVENMSAFTCLDWCVGICYCRWTIVEPHSRQSLTLRHRAVYSRPLLTSGGWFGRRIAVSLSSQQSSLNVARYRLLADVLMLNVFSSENWTFFCKFYCLSTQKPPTGNDRWHSLG